jgi:hypothetical protein
MIAEVVGATRKKRFVFKVLQPHPARSSAVQLFGRKRWDECYRLRGEERAEDDSAGLDHCADVFADEGSKLERTSDST